MNLPRILTVTVIAATTALAVSSVPAQAATLSPAVVAEAYSVMLTASQAQSVGISKQHLAVFGVESATKGTPNAPWLCELIGNNGIEGQGAGKLISSDFMNLGGKSVLDIGQEIHWYASEKAAKKAYDGIVKKIKSCEGQQTSASEVAGDTTSFVPTTLTNGTKKSKDGDQFLWVNSETIMGDATANFADHDYATVRHFGSFIQILDLQSEGLDAAPLTKKQIAAADGLTDSLGDVWQATFR